MRILSMTATFGKLEGETLRLKPGLNVITAPNEWGKSTWCAFLLAMFYGVDTRQRTKTGVLADKEHYKPWSGKPMEGTVELSWESRKITIQRRTSGRIPMGEFRAFETDTGLPVPELTANNCGQVLLGVERSVYQRSGFLHGGDLPVTQDENFNRRLNQLVTTGDDSDVAPNLENKLRDLRNKVQYNRTGLLPKAKADLERQQKLREDRKAIADRIQMLSLREEQITAERKSLQDHLSNLQSRENRQKLELVDQARLKEIRAEERLSQCREAVSKLPERILLVRQLAQVAEVENSVRALELEAASTEPDQNVLGDYPSLEQAKIDAESIRENPESGSLGNVLLIVGLILTVAGAGLFLALHNMLWLAAAILGICLAGAGAWMGKRIQDMALEQEKVRSRIQAIYGTVDRAEMVRRAASHEKNVQQRLEQLNAWQREEEERRTRREELYRKFKTLPTRVSLETGIALWDEFEDAHRSAIRTKAYREDLEVMTRDLQSAKEAEKDDLTLDTPATRTMLERNLEQGRQVRSRLDEARGEISTLPGEETILREVRYLEARVQELEKWYSALSLSLELLGKAQRELQSRFAPQLSREAKKILRLLTDGRYDRLLLEEDLTLSAGAEGEGTMVSSCWRSDGTSDQMYLALRLAVCRVMLPNAPVILDDALNRFDETRMAAAMSLLNREGEDRQIILFTCQNREYQWLTSQGQ